MDQFIGDPDWKTPGVKGTDKNPFLDKRVREAVSKAINRQAIVERIMGGVAVAAGELLPVPLFGTSPDMKPAAFDPEGAKKLLAEAGYPNGFEVTLGTPNDRYINDEKIAQAVGADADPRRHQDQCRRHDRLDLLLPPQQVRVLALPRRLGRGYGRDVELARGARRDAGSRRPGMGHTNRGRYSNPELDALIKEAQRTVDDAKREEVLRQASKLAMSDFPLVPLHFEVTPWAFKKGLTYKARVDQYTLATEVRPAS